MRNADKNYNLEALNVSVRTVMSKNRTVCRLKGRSTVPGIIYNYILENQQINSKCRNKDLQHGEAQGS